MLIVQLTRARDITAYLDTALKNLGVRIEVQSLIRTFLELGFLLHIVGCFWMASTEANLYSFNTWLCGNDLQD